MQFLVCLFVFVHLTLLSLWQVVSVTRQELRVTSVINWAVSATAKETLLVGVATAAYPAPMVSVPKGAPLASVILWGPWITSATFMTVSPIWMSGEKDGRDQSKDRMFDDHNMYPLIVHWLIDTIVLKLYIFSLHFMMQSNFNTFSWHVKYLRFRQM